MKESRITILFEKYLSNRLTKDEALELQHLLTMDDNSEKLRFLIQEQFKNNDNDQDMELSWLDDLETSVLKSLKSPSRKSLTVINLWGRFVAAAILLAIIGISLYPFLNNRDQHSPLMDVEAGGNRATLQLADGQKINLSEQQSKIILGKDLSYSDGTKIPVINDKNGEFQDIIFTVPKKGTYSIVLSDGTKVWLNADSRLKTHFNARNKMREVELEGEAYFEVSHHNYSIGKKIVSLPFIVKTPTHSVTVLGTAFNIAAYKGEKSKTTLITGSVEIGTLNGKISKHLKPNQQAVVGKDSIFIENVESSNYSAWIDGTFNFSDEPLNEILNEVSRWYDVKVVYKNENLKNLRFEGVIPRYENLSTLLNTLEKSGEVKFILKDNTIHVNPK